MSTTIPADLRSDWRERIAAALDDAIHQDGRDAQDIAQLAGISAAQLSRLRNGKRGLSLAVAEDLDGVLSCDVDLAGLVRTERATLRAAANAAIPRYLKRLSYLPVPTALPAVA